MSHLTELIPTADKAVLEAAFQQHKEALPDKTPEKFIEDIVWRVYTELCCSRAGRRVTSPYPQAGEAFKRWTDQEIHFALEGIQVNEAKYEEVRQAVMNAVVARATELFSAWKGKTYPEDKNDERNLRASLRSYLPPHLQYEQRPAGVTVGESQPPVIEQKPDGTTEVRWHDEDTVMFARGTPDRPLPELLLKDPQRAADLLFGTWERPQSEAPTVITVEEPMPNMPEGASSLEINTGDDMVAHNLGMPLMMATGSITTRNGSVVTLSLSKEKFSQVWEVCKRNGIKPSMLSFR